MKQTSIDVALLVMYSDFTFGLQADRVMNEPAMVVDFMAMFTPQSVEASMLVDMRTHFFSDVQHVTLQEEHPRPMVRVTIHGMLQGGKDVIDQGVVDNTPLCVTLFKPRVTKLDIDVAQHSMRYAIDYVLKRHVGIACDVEHIAKACVSRDAISLMN